MKLWACVDSEENATYKSIIRSESPPEMKEDGWDLDEDCIIGDIDGDSVTELACRDLAPGRCQEIARLDLIKWEVERVGPVLDGKPKPVPACPVLAEKGLELIVVINQDASWKVYPFNHGCGCADRILSGFAADISGPPGSWPSVEGGGQ